MFPTFTRSFSRLLFFVCFFIPTALFAQIRSALPTSGLISECDFCMGSQGISPLEMGHTGVRYDIRYLDLSRPFSNGVEKPNSNGYSETHFTQQFTFLYHFLPDLSASILIPYSSRHSTSSPGLDPFDGSATEPELNSASGLADISILARYNLLTDHSIAGTAIAAVSAGLKLPTGSTKAMDAEGELLEPDLQLGTGSLDGIIGLSGLLAWTRVSIAANVSAILTGRGANDHSYGNNLSYDLTGRYRVYPASIDFPSVFATAGITGELRGHEKEYDAETGWSFDPDSGGDITYAAPGLQIFFSPFLSFEGDVQIPIYHGLNGDQIGETVRIVSGLQYMF